MVLSGASLVAKGFKLCTLQSPPLPCEEFFRVKENGAWQRSAVTRGASVQKKKTMRHSFRQQKQVRTFVVVSCQVWYAACSTKVVSWNNKLSLQVHGSAVRKRCEQCRRYGRGTILLSGVGLGGVWKVEGNAEFRGGLNFAVVPVKKYAFRTKP